MSAAQRAPVAAALGDDVAHALLVRAAGFGVGAAFVAAASAVVVSVVPGAALGAAGVAACLVVVGVCLGLTGFSARHNVVALGVMLALAASSGALVGSVERGLDAAFGAALLTGTGAAFGAAFVAGEVVGLALLLSRRRALALAGSFAAVVVVAAVLVVWGEALSPPCLPFGAATGGALAALAVGLGRAGDGVVAVWFPPSAPVSAALLRVLWLPRQAALAVLGTTEQEGPL